MSGRKHHLVVQGKKDPRQRIWESIRVLAPGFSINDIARRTGQRPYDISVYLKALTTAGIIELIEAPGGKASRVFALLRDEGADHPRVNSKGQRTYEHLATENIWRTLRILGGDLTVPDVVLTASVGNVALTPIKVRQYLTALTEAGYLEKKEGGGQVADTYRLLSEKNTGPRPPEIRQLESLQVYDPNLSKLVHVKTTGSIDADRSLVEPGIALIRSRDLLAEWLDVAARKAKLPADLVERTRLELAEPGESGGLQ
ncbi:hypothetical protein [Pseudomonas sp. Irchel 3E13]|uniref:hypothetical protein n=1 Tax=Pseudomonas sp. Irchel 3E13 TaxID=2008975 RepID=UPI000BA4AA8B|nr:hypothetical protein [Pseudomonas sp. Irchel 3E13]